MSGLWGFGLFLFGLYFGFFFLVLLLQAVFIFGTVALVTVKYGPATKRPDATYNWH